MSDTPSHQRIPKDSRRPDQEVFDFREEHYEAPVADGPLPDPAEDFSPPPPDPASLPDPFEDFSPPPARPTLGLDDLPSLDDLFKPFDLNSPTPEAIDEEGYQDIYTPKAAEEYVYEDLDTRDPEVVRTLNQAEAEAKRIIDEAEAARAEILARAETEAKGLAAEVQAAEREKLEKSLAAAAEKNQAADERFYAAEETLKSAEAELAEAERVKTETEQSLAELNQRLTGLDEEGQRLAAEFEARKAEFEAAKEEMMNQARQAAHSEGREAGFSEGLAAGEKRAAEEFQAKVEHFLAVADKLENIYHQLWQANGPLMIKLAVESVERILNKELPRAEGLAAAAFKACVDYLTRAHQVTVLVRPEDMAQMELARADQRARLGALVKVDFKADESLGPGDLIIESDIGRLDATVKHRAGQIMDALREAFDRQYDQPVEDRAAANESEAAEAETPEAEAPGAETPEAPEASGPPAAAPEGGDNG